MWYFKPKLIKIKFLRNIFTKEIKWEKLECNIKMFFKGEEAGLVAKSAHLLKINNSTSKHRTHSFN